MKRKKIMIFSISFIFIIGVFFSSYKIINWYISNQKNKKLNEELLEIVENSKDEINEKEQEDVIDFSKALELNKDIVGYLVVNGTNIKYLVVQGKDNDFYLNHSIDKSYNISGSIFVNFLNKLDGTDKNISIFGHNTRDGSMFGTLRNVLTKEWKANPLNLKIEFITLNGKQIYEVFSTYKIKAENYYFKNSFSSELEYIEFLNTLKKRSDYDYQTDILNSNEIITISSCDVDNKYRVVLHAKRISI